MKDKIQEMIQTLEKEKKRLEAIRDEKINVHLQNIELLNEHWTPNTMEMFFYHVEIEKYLAKICILKDILNVEK